MMKRLKRRLSQTLLRPVASAGFLSFGSNDSDTANGGRGSGVNFLSSNSNATRRSKSTVTLQEDSISELAERLEENGLIYENGKC